MKDTRFRYCFRCGESLIIKTEHPAYRNMEKMFNFNHQGHLTAILSEEEIAQYSESKLLMSQIRNNNRLIREFNTEGVVENKLMIVHLQQVNKKLKKFLKTLPMSESITNFWKEKPVILSPKEYKDTKIQVIEITEKKLPQKERILHKLLKDIIDSNDTD